jgi:hypothetical protein
MLSLKSQSVMLDKITAHDQSSQNDTKAILDEGSTTEMYEYDLFCHEAMCYQFILAVCYVALGVLLSLK